MSRPTVAIIDDYQSVARTVADWSAVEALADVTVFTRAWRDQDDIVATLAPFDVLVLMRERTPIPRSLVVRLPKLRMVAMTGHRSTTIDFAACTERGIVVSHTTANPSAAPAELAFALILACARSLPQGHINVVAGRVGRGRADGHAAREPAPRHRRPRQARQQGRPVRAARSAWTWSRGART